MMIQHNFFFTLAFIGTALFALVSLSQAYAPKTFALQRFHILAFSGLYLTYLCIFVSRDYSDMFFKFPSHDITQIISLPIAITALFLIYHLFLLCGFWVWSTPNFTPERLYTYFLVFLSAIGLVASDEPAWILLLMELTGFATIALIAMQGSNNARAVAFTYLVFSSLATLLYCLGVLFSLPTPAALVPFGSVSGLLPALLLGSAFLIKLGLGPFARYLVDGQTVATYPDFVFISTVGKLPYLIALFNLAPTFLTETARAILLTLVIVFAIVAAVLLVSEQTIRRFFAYSSLFNSALAVAVILFSPALGNFFIGYMCYYLYISLLLYLAFSFFGFFETFNALLNYPRPEPHTFRELSTRTNSGGAGFAFMAALLFSSGLPPFGIFIAKALALGWLFLGGAVTETSYLLAFTYLFISMVNMVAYFRAMLVSVQSRSLALIPAATNGELVTPKAADDQQRLLTWGAYLFYGSLAMLIPFYYFIFQLLAS